ncbi:hypothetical protein AAVH_43179, partial [Aphelenchoides avenae]
MSNQHPRNDSSGKASGSSSDFVVTVHLNEVIRTLKSMRSTAARPQKMCSEEQSKGPICDCCKMSAPPLRPTCPSDATKRLAPHHECRTFDDIIRKIEAKQGSSLKPIKKTDHSDKKESSNRSSDDETWTWRSYTGRLGANLADLGCPLLSKKLDAMIDGMLAKLPSQNTSIHIPLEDHMLVDVFLPLSRFSLDEVQFTCHRFNKIVATHLADFCHRRLMVKIKTPKDIDFLVALLGPPPGREDAGLYRVTIQGETDAAEGGKRFRQIDSDCDTLSKMFDKCVERMPQTTFVRCLELHSFEVLQQLVGTRKDLAARMIVGSIVIHRRGNQRCCIDASQVFDLLSAFRTVRGLEFSSHRLHNVNDVFLRRCREIGLVTLFLQEHEGALTVDGLFDFLFGPTRQELEGVNRFLAAWDFFDKELFGRLLK